MGLKARENTDSDKYEVDMLDADESFPLKKNSVVVVFVLSSLLLLLVAMVLEVGRLFITFFPPPFILQVLRL